MFLSKCRVQRGNFRWFTSENDELVEDKIIKPNLSIGHKKYEERDDVARKNLLGMVWSPSALSANGHDSYERECKNAGKQH